LADPDGIDARWDEQAGLFDGVAVTVAKTQKESSPIV
jgi:hypothetical protein